MYNETSIWFEWGAATQSNGESLVRIQHCPATVNRWQLWQRLSQNARQKLHLVQLTYEVLGEPTTLFICLYHLRQ
jgi:hypothetical protein